VGSVAEALAHYIDTVSGRQRQVSKSS
jgi:hypothetical protein